MKKIVLITIISFICISGYSQCKLDSLYKKAIENQVYQNNELRKEVLRLNDTIEVQRVGFNLRINEFNAKFVDQELRYEDLRFKYIKLEKTKNTWMTVGITLSILIVFGMIR